MSNHKLSLIGAAAVVASLVCEDLKAKDLDADLRQQVIASCSGDAMKLCPQSLTSQNEAVSCMRTKRRELSPVCRAAYDRVVRVLAQR